MDLMRGNTRKWGLVARTASVLGRSAPAFIGLTRGRERSQRNYAKAQQPAPS